MGGWLIITVFYRGEMITLPIPEGEKVDWKAQAAGRLAALLSMARQYDTEYEVRYKLVFAAIGAALDAGYEAGFRIDPAEPEWPVAYIELPTGQVSWHMPQHPNAWDGHSTEEKFARIDAFVEG